MEFSIVLLGELLALAWWIFINWWYSLRLLADIRWIFRVCKSSICWGLIVILNFISLMSENFYSLRFSTIIIYFLITSVSIIHTSLIPILPDISLKLLLCIIYSYLFFRRVWLQISRIDNNWIEWTFIIIRMTDFVNPWSDWIHWGRLNLIWRWLNYLSYGIYLVTCCVSIINFLRFSPFFRYMLNCLVRSSPQIRQLLLKILFELLNLQLVLALNFYNFLLFPF